MLNVKQFFIFVFIISGVCYSTAGAGFLRLNHMKIDPNSWGERTIEIPIENPSTDTARLEISLTVGYANHYLSCDDTTHFDTSLVIPPKFDSTETVHFFLDGSFGRAKIMLMAKWIHDNDPEPAHYDSTFQTFANNFSAHGYGEGLDNYRYVLGAMHATWFDRNFDFEYPRLLLYLCSRDKTVHDVQNMFHPQIGYTRQLAEHFRSRGLLSENEKDAVKTFFAMSEDEGFAVHPKVMKFADEIQSWYQSDGGKKLDKYLRESGIDSTAAALPALRMTILYSLLVEPWLDGEFTDWKAFTDPVRDIGSLNRPRWLVQGGAFFQPRVCMASFTGETPDEVMLGVFVPDYTLTCSKLPLIFMHERAKKDLSIRDAAIATISASNLEDAMERCRDKKLVKDLEKKLKEVIEKTQKDLPFYEDAMRGALADYICRVALASNFVDEPQGMLDKFVIVRY